MPSGKVALQDILKQLGGEFLGPSKSLEKDILRIMPLAAAGSSDISFFSAAKYASQFASSNAACVIAKRADWVLARDAGYLGACIATEDPYLYFANLTTWWQINALRSPAHVRIHPSAVISASAKISPTATVGPLCVIEDGASLGDRSHLKSRVTLGQDCQIGADCIVHSGVVIGADGFGFAQDKSDGSWVKIAQLGRVTIGNQVEIGANTCIDRGALDDTVIEDGVKLDNLIQIGHNVRIGKHTALAGCVGVAGSANIGAHCTVGGGAVVLGHLEIADNVHISAATVVTKSIKKPGMYTGFFPIDDNDNWEKNAVTLKQLHLLRERIKQLERK
jgi:UDP-3-O-[3-hydroxymyristoyl] glucosamine N-acyltransferase